MASDAAVRDLVDREAIRQVLVRYCRAVDRRDEERLRSVYHPDAVHEHGAYRMNGHEFATVIVESIAQYTCTTHFLTNATIELERPLAHVESYVLAVHRFERAGAERALTLALRYLDRFEWRDQAWRIAERVAVHDWSRDEPVTGRWSDADSMVQGRRDREDASYRGR